MLLNCIVVRDILYHIVVIGGLFVFLNSLLSISCPALFVKHIQHTVMYHMTRVIAQPFVV